MANTAKFRCTVEYDGSNFLIWQGNILLLTTNKPADLVAACRGRIVAPQAKPTKSVRFETPEEFLARGGKIKQVKVTPLGFELTEDDILSAAASLHGTPPPPAPAKIPGSPQIELDNFGINP